MAVNEKAPTRSISGGSSNATWDAVAHRYDSERADDPVYDACVRRTVADLGPLGVVLDAGCGTGLGTRLLLTAKDTHAVDYSPESIAVLKSRGGLTKNVHTAVADIRSLPFPDGFFDNVLCANTLQHLDSSGQRAAVKEILRVLKPHGRYSVSVHHFSRDKQKAGWIKEGKPGQQEIDYIFRFTRAELRALFPNARIRAVGFYGWPLQMITSAVLGEFLARLGRGHMLIAFGRK